MGYIAQEEKIKEITYFGHTIEIYKNPHGYHYKIPMDKPFHYHKLGKIVKTQTKAIQFAKDVIRKMRDPNYRPEERE